MPTATPVRTVKVSETDETYDPYTALIAAILARALAAAQRETFAPAPQSPPQVQQEARDWWAEESHARALLDLANLPGDAVLRRVRVQLAQVSVFPGGA